MDILDTIDAATGALCACGCGHPLPADGPSAWWASEFCQERWQSGVDPEAYRRQREERRAAARALVEARVQAVQAELQVVVLNSWGVVTRFVEGLAGIAPAMQTLVDQMSRYWPPPQPEPVDPMQRAIEAKRNRNTGPKARPRTPRRIDPRGAR